MLRFLRQLKPVQLGYVSFEQFEVDFNGNICLLCLLVREIVEYRHKMVQNLVNWTQELLNVSLCNQFSLRMHQYLALVPQEVCKLATKHYCRFATAIDTKGQELT